VKFDVVTTNTFLVEDNPAIRAHLAELLELLANVNIVGSANNPVSASMWLLAHPGAWELAIIDLNLVGGTGYAVLAALHERDGEHRAIVVSNDVTSEARRRCLTLGADGVFDKTTEVDSLLLYCGALSLPSA
jgi:DNA-binding NarL/FixJ family response regulator